MFPGEFADIESLSGSGTRLVVAATQVALDRRVAIKVLRGAAGESRMLPDEIRLHARLSDHSHVLSLHEVRSTPGGDLWLILELAEGGSLQAGINGTGSMSVDRLLEIGTQTCGALAALHADGVVHADIKPSNILVAADGSCRLADFGISRSLDTTIDTLESLKGSLRYVAPELFDGAAPSAANDIYSLVLTLRAALTGVAPFGPSGQAQAAIIARLHSDDLAFPDTDPGLPSHLVELLNAALSRDPDARPTAAQLEAAFDGARCGGFGGEVVGGRPAPPWWSRHRVALGAIVVAAGLIGGVTGGVAVGSLGDDSDQAAPAVDPGSVDAAYCAVFASATDERIALMQTMASDLEQSPSSTAVVLRLLVTYPRQFSEVTGPLVAAARDTDGGPSVGNLGDGQLTDLALADSFRSLAGGKPFLFDGDTGEFNPRELPSELREPAREISELFADARQRCPEVEIDLAAAKARLSSATFSNLADAEFMSSFFDDPASFDVFEPRTVVLMVDLARSTFEQLVAGRSDWFAMLLDRRPDIRAAVAFHHPDVILETLAAVPSSIDLVDEAWRTDIVVGLARLDSASRIGVAELYAEQLALIGVDASGVAGP